jgi:murein DD-endopeptidase MepM/ murein hydrolase activator NlpD
MSKFLHGIHDPGGEHLMREAPGWIVHTVALREVGGFDFTPWSRQGFTNICRINWGYHPHGTIPTNTDSYVAFARRVRDFIRNAPGCDLFILGNEPNHEIERPDGVLISPHDYALCFNTAYATVKSELRQAQLGVAAIAPWNQQSGDWLDYWRAMLVLIGECDFLTLHAYTHGVDPQLVESNQMVNGWLWHFPVFTQMLANVPPKFIAKPAHITEADQDAEWANVNSGWIQRACAFVDNHNKKAGTQKVFSISFYRWQTHNHDKWHFNDKPGVQEDFKQAVAARFMSPPPLAAPIHPTTIVLPDIRKEPTPMPPSSVLARTLTPAADAHGMRVVTPALNPGQEFWYAEYVDKLNKDQSGGRRHIYGNVTDKNGNRLHGVRLRVSWENGNKEAFVVTEDKSRDLPPWSFDYNFPLSSSLNDFAIEVAQDRPSEKVTGIGMGINGNPGEHTVSVVNFTLENYPGSATPVPVPVTPVPVPVTPTPVPVTPANTLIILPVTGIVTQRWGENPQNYARFGIPGHNGLDIGAPAGKAVHAIANGTVAFAGEDSDYGNYVRIHHPHLGFDSFYAHLLTIDTAIGKPVSQGEKIGTVGSTGNSSGPHLHLETRLTRQMDNYIVLSGGYGKGRFDPAIAYWLLNRQVV